MRPWLLQLHLPHLGTLALSAWFFWLLMALGAGVAMTVQEARRSGEPPLPFLRVAVAAVLGGTVGGRLGHILTVNRATYLEDPLALLRFWEGGMVLYGGLALGGLAALLLARRLGVSILRLGDAAAPGLALGIALGRVGCLAAGCCYGRPIDWGSGVEWPWGLVFLGGAVPEALRGIPLHPTQVYAAINGLQLFAGLRWLRTRQRFDGQVLGVLLLGYGLTRPLLELFRLDLERGFLLPELFGDRISTSQALSVPVVLAGLALLAFARRRAGAQGVLGLGPAAARDARTRRRIEAALATA